MTAHPGPIDLPCRSQSVEPGPEVLVYVPPIVAGHSIHEVRTVAVERNLTAWRGLLEPFDGGQHLHPIIGGAVLTARVPASPVRSLYHRSPSSGAGIPGAGPVRV